MKISPNVGTIDGTPGDRPSTGTDIHQPRLPTRLPQSNALAPISSGSVEQASRTDPSARDRARTFRYGPADAPAAASDAADLVRASSSVRDMRGLQDLTEKLLSSAQAASNSGVSLEQHYLALGKAAACVARWPSGQDKGLRELRSAYLDMPEADETSLEAKNTAREKIFGFPGTQFAQQVTSAQSFVDKFWQLLDHIHQWPGSGRAAAISAFLKESVDRLKTFPAGEVAEGHQLLSDAIQSSPQRVAAAADKRLCELEANELLPPGVKAAYEQGERLAKSAESVSDLPALHKLLSTPGIAGPDVPDDLLGLARLSEYDGNFQLRARLRPEPLAVLATRVGNFKPTEANEAFCAIFDKVDGIQPASRRVASLMALATAANHLADPEAREQASARVLNTTQTLRKSQDINSEQQELVLKALSRSRYGLAA